MKKLLTIFLVMMTLLINAQVNNQGEIIYEEVTKMKFEMTDEQKARLKQMDITIPNSFINEKRLLFTSKEAIYLPVEKEETPEANQGRSFRMMRSFRGSGILYQDLVNNDALEQKEFMTRQFLIQGEEDEEKPKWKMTTEQKEILGYKCQKAILIPPKKDTTQQENKDRRGWGNTESTTEAWFTMQIPVSVGPEKYKGLPGTILELKNDFKNRRGGGTRTITATKVDLRALEGNEIEKPSKGKKVTREEFREIVKEKMKEMRENGGGYRRYMRD